MGVRWSRMSWSEKNELWTRWRHGESLRDIGHALRRAKSVVYAAVGDEGGIAPRPRRRSRLALTTTAGRDFAPASTGRIATGHRSDAQPSAINAESRSRAKRGARGISSDRRRRAGLAAEPPSAALSSGHPPGTAARRGSEAGAAVVVAAGRGLAPILLSERS
jgi:hypothetical protein